MMDAEYGLAFAFPDGSHSFVHGFEAGQIMRRMDDGEPEIKETLHSENVEVFQRMAAYKRYTCEVTPTSVQGWVEIRFGRAAKLVPPLTLVPGGALG